jgi:hypothetical protein
MSALGQKQTFAPQKAMSALPPIATAKAYFRTRSCLLYPRKRMCSALAYVCFGPIADIACSEMREAANGGIVQIVIFLA